MKSRPNDLAQRIDLRPLGQRSATGQAPDQISFQARVSAGLTMTEAARLTSDGIEFVALSLGWTDPREAVATVRSALDLPAEEDR
jgi:hypothetical protein